MDAAEPHRQAMQAAIETEAAAQRALLERRDDDAREHYAEAVGHWRASWRTAPPRSFGRLVGMIKAAVLAGDAEGVAREVRTALGDDADSAVSAYALAVAALASGDEALATRAAARMRGASDAFERTAEAIEALGAGDGARFERALREIVADFETREAHLTGVAFADTALLLDRLAEPRGLAVRPPSPVLPP